MLAMRQIMLGTPQGNAEEEMYKEMYVAVVSGVSSFGSELVDNVSTRVRSWFMNGLNAFTKLSFQAATYLDAHSLRGNTVVQEVDCPLVEHCGSYTFFNDSSLTTVKLPKCANLGAVSLQGCSSLVDVFLDDVTFSDAIGFPWSCSNPNTVFHFKDGDYDYQGNPISA